MRVRRECRRRVGRRGATRRDATRSVAARSMATRTVAGQVAQRLVWACASAWALVACGGTTGSPGDGGVPADGMATDAPIPGDAGTDASTDDAGAAGCVRWSGVQRFGTPASDEGRAVYVDARGYVFVGGWEGTSSPEPSPTRNTEGVVIELAPDGSLIRRVRLTEPTAHTVDALVEGPDGLRAVGRHAVAREGRSSFDVAVWALTAELATAWSRSSGRLANEHPVRARVAGDGATWVAGYDDIYIPTNYVEAWEDRFLIRLDEAGEMRWNEGSEVTDFGFALSVDDEGVLYGGNVQSGVGRGAFVAALGSDGGEAWRRVLSPVGLDAVQWVRRAQDGRILVAGATWSLLGSTAYGEQDVFVGWLDAEGTPERFVQLGGSATDWLADAIVDEDGSAILVGETFGELEPGVPVQGEVDGFVAFIDATGSVRRVRQLSGDGEDSVTSVARDACGQAIVTGYAVGPLEDTEPRGGRDLIVAVVPAP